MDTTINRISDFKAQMANGGARPNQFRVTLNFPTGVGEGGEKVYITKAAEAFAKIPFLCSATSLPGSSVANIPVAYRGRTVNFAGERSFQPWGVTVYTDTDFDIRNAMEQWQSQIQNYASTNGVTQPVAYQADMVVEQLGRDDTVLKTYVFKDAYPTEIGAIGLDFGTDNQIESFTLTFQYNYFTSIDSTDLDNYVITAKSGRIGGV